MVLWLVVTGFFGYQLRHLTVDFEFEKLFPKDDPDIAFYESHLEHFAYDNDYLMIVLQNEEGVFDSSFLQKTRQLTQKLKDLEDITTLNSPTALRQLVKTPLGTSAYPVLHIEDPDRYKKDSIKVYGHPVYRSFFSQNGKALMMIAQHQHYTDPEKSGALLRQVKQLMDDFAFSQSRIVGKIAAQETFSGYIRSDFLLFFGLALVAGLIILLYLFDAVKIALIPILIGITSLIWMLGTMSLLGKSISILGSLIPPVILFVSTSDAIHLINACRKSGETSINYKLIAGVQQVFVPTLLTSITTAIGFASLWIIDTEPIRDFGVFCALGTVFAFTSSYLFIPLLLPAKIPEKTPNQPLLQRFSKWVIRHPKWIYTSYALIIILSVIGIRHLDVDAYLLDDLPKDDAMRQSFEYVDEEFGGSKPWEMAFWPKGDQKIWNQQVMNEAAKIHRYLKSEYPLSGLLSPVSLLKYGNQMNEAGQNEAFRFPDKQDYQAARQQIRQYSQSGQIVKTIDATETYGRFTGFIPEYGSQETNKRNKQLLKYLEENIDHQVIEYRLTGTTYLIDKSHELLSFNLLKGLGIAILFIGVALGVYFRSFKILLLSLLPNLIPLMITAAFMGIAGFSLKLTTSIIFAVTFGIAVDDTIHFIAAYQENPSRNVLRKYLFTFMRTGHSLMLTTAIIVTGFALFLLSDFGATFYTGLLMCISLITALITDLTLLPLILVHSENISIQKWLRRLWRNN